MCNYFSFIKVFYFIYDILIMKVFTVLAVVTPVFSKFWS